MIDGALTPLDQRRRARNVVVGVLTACACVAAALGSFASLEDRASILQTEIRVLQREGHVDRALVSAQAWAKHEPRNPAVRLALAEVLEAAGRSEEARVEIEEAVKLGGSKIELGWWLAKHARWEELRAFLDHFPEAERNTADYCELGVQAAAARLDWEAVKGFGEKMLALPPESNVNPDAAHYTIGIAEMRLGRTEEARAHLEVAANSKDETMRSSAVAALQYLTADSTATP